MRRLVYILLLMMAAGTVACHRTPGEAERQLIYIDSLIASAPDSALTLLAALSPSLDPQPAGTSELSRTSGTSEPSGDSSPSKLEGARGSVSASDEASPGSVSASNVASPVRMTAGERAYHALLTAQAMYKAYIPATTDSVINVAWDYYSDLGMFASSTDRQRRVRALLYKGTTAEELGHPDSAMYWYKRTELEAAPDDHYHRGYALMSMGKIFQDYYVFICAIPFFRQAIEEFNDTSLIGNKIYCLHNLGVLYRNINLDSALFYFDAVKKDALNSHLNYDYYAALSEMVACFNLQKRYNKALETANQVFTNTNDTFVLTHATYFACEAACMLQMPDSAKRMYEKLPPPVSTRDSFMYDYTLRLIAISLNKKSVADSLKDRYNELADKLMYNKYRDILQNQINISEKSYLKQVSTSKSHFYFIIFAILLLILILSLYFLNLRRKTAEIKAVNLFSSNKQIRLLLEQSKFDIDQMMQRITNIEINNNNFKKRAFELQSLLISELLKSYDNKSTSHNNEKTLQAKELVWLQMRKFADNISFSIITRLEQQFPSLSEKDKKIIMMYICGCSIEVITIALGYTNSKSVKNRLRIMPKEVMGINMTVPQLVEEIQSGNLQILK